MTMAAGLAQDLTNGERIESALVVIASALSGKRPSQLFPWLRNG